MQYIIYCTVYISVPDGVCAVSFLQVDGDPEDDEAGHDEANEQPHQDKGPIKVDPHLVLCGSNQKGNSIGITPTLDPEQPTVVGQIRSIGQDSCRTQDIVTQLHWVLGEYPAEVGR